MPGIRLSVCSIEKAAWPFSHKAQLQARTLVALHHHIHLPIDTHTMRWWWGQVEEFRVCKEACESTPLTKL